MTLLYLPQLTTSSDEPSDYRKSQPFYIFRGVLISFSVNDGVQKASQSRFVDQFEFLQALLPIPCTIQIVIF